MPIFVDRVAPGDDVDVQLFDVRKDFAKGKAVAFHEYSGWRAEPPCPVFNICGGCQWQHMGYMHQVEAKTQIVRQALKHIGKIDDSLVLNAIPALKPLTYRNKAQFPVGAVGKTGRILAGYYKQNSHELINIKFCPIESEPMDRALEATKDLLTGIGISAYDEKRNAGLLRHIAERYSFAFNKILLTLVLNTKPTQLNDGMRKSLKAVAADLMQRVPEVSGVCLNFNDRPGNRIMGDTTECIAGEPYLIEKLSSRIEDAPDQLKNGIDFRLSSTSFFQVNSEQACTLLDEVLLAVLLQRNDEGAKPDFSQKIPLVIDAYAGVGTIGMWLSPVAERVIAIEEMSSSVSDGRVNAEMNRLSNFEFHEAKVEHYVPKLLASGTKPDAVVVDPPRKGIDLIGLQSIIQLGAPRIVYVSCNPATLARDLRILEDNGYKTKRVQPIDMFPQTHHIESVTVLDKAIV